MEEFPLVDGININSNVNTKSASNTTNTPQNHYQITKGVVPSQTCDTFEAQGKDKKNGKFPTWAKVVSVVGGAAILVSGMILGKKKLDSNKAKKLEAEAKRLAEEARQREEVAARQRAEAAARQREEAAARQREEAAARQREEAAARQREEAAARQREEAAARQREEAAAKQREEAAARAKIEANNKIINEITTNFEDKSAIKYCGKSAIKMSCDEVNELQKPISCVTLDEYAQFFVDSVRKAEEEGLNKEGISKIFEKMHDSANLSDSQIETLTHSYDEVYEFSYKVKHQLKARKQFIQDLDKLMQENPQKENEKMSDYLQKLVNKRKENVEQAKQKRIETIKSRLQYDEAASNKERIELKPEEVEELRSALVERKVTEQEKEEIQKADLDKLISEYIREATSDYDAPDVSDRVQKACFNRLNRYNSRTSTREYDYNRDSTYQHEPLYRWMRMGNKCDEFAETTFKVGETYTFPQKQSCSKDKWFAETMYGETNPSMNFKFVIHPKSETSRAVDVGCGNYGCNEAIYLKGEKFKVIDMYDEEVVNPSAVLGSLSWSNERSFYHKVVHLQEL